MEKYGFFGGCFNPVTKAHIQLGLDCIVEFNLNKVVYVPVGNHYQKPDLAEEMFRYEMLKLATSKEKNLEVSDIELRQTRAMKSIEAFAMLQRNYPNKQAYFIMGADNFSQLMEWKEPEKLVCNYQYIIVERANFDCHKIMEETPLLQQYQSHFHFLSNSKHPYTNATQVRLSLQEKRFKELEQVLEKEVQEYIIQHNLYGTKKEEQ